VRGRLGKLTILIATVDVDHRSTLVTATSSATSCWQMLCIVLGGGGACDRLSHGSNSPAPPVLSAHNRPPRLVHFNTLMFIHFSIAKVLALELNSA